MMITKAKAEGELVIAGSLADYFMERAEGFKKKYPFIQVKGLSLNTTKTVNRIVAEVQAGRPSIDLEETTDEGGMILFDAGTLQKPEPFPHMRDFNPKFQPSSGMYVCLVGSPVVQGAYNTDLVAAEELPRTWEEMTSPRWKGRVIISASGEEVPGQLAWVWRKDGQLDWDGAFDFYRKLKAQDPLITRGYRGGAEQLATGEKSFFWFSVTGPPAVKRLDDGAPLGLIAFPKFVTVFRAAGIVKGAPHPASAWLFIDYLMSPEGQHWYTDVASAKLVLNTKAKPGRLAEYMMSEGVTFENSELLDSDFSVDAMGAALYNPENLKKSKDFFFELMGIR
jgi:iron(III) transport system substrate-binding protein